jgi:TRAP-type mannitol/chloroaromatic compound transport system permease large subunit
MGLFAYPQSPNGSPDSPGGTLKPPAAPQLFSGVCPPFGSAKADVAVAAIIATTIIAKTTRVVTKKSTILLQVALTVICAPPSLCGAGEGK